MLVLSRKVNQKIRVGDVEITIVRLGAAAVRIGIEAPPDVPIVRTELLSGAAGPRGAAGAHRSSEADCRSSRQACCAAPAGPAGVAA